MWIKDPKVAGLYRREFASGRASYAVRKREGHRVLTITLGDTASVTLEEARKRALEQFGDRVRSPKEKTLQSVQDAYLKSHTIKASSATALKSSIKTHFADWLDRPIAEVTREMVEQRIKKIVVDAAKRSKSRTANEKGRGAQNKASRYLKALFKFAVEEDWLAKDPTLVIKAKRLTKTLKRRQSYLLPNHRRALLGALKNAERGISDLVTLLMFTGCRISEALSLTWEDIDTTNRYLTFRDTKNGQDHVVAYSRAVGELFKDREGKGPFLLWKDNTPIKNPYEHLVALGKEIECPFSPHDLRRTWATVADEVGIPRDTIKGCLNHITGHDVTAGYIVRSPERLRAAFQQVEDAIYAAQIQP